MAISTSDIISATSRRSEMASVRPFRAARLNHLCAATRLTTPERPLAHPVQTPLEQNVGDRACFHRCRRIQIDMPLKHLSSPLFDFLPCAPRARPLSSCLKRPVL